jgi:hypothetical protein
MSRVAGRIGKTTHHRANPGLDRDARALVAFFLLTLLAMMLVFSLTVIGMLVRDEGATVAAAIGALVTFLSAVAAVVRTYLRRSTRADEED